MTKDEELAKYLAQIEQYKEQINSLEMQFSYLQAAINDYNKAKMTLEHLDKVEKNTEILIPIGGSTFINAISTDTSKVLFDIGSGIVTEKNTQDAMDRIDKRLEDLQKTQDRLSSMMQQLQAEAIDISTKAQKLYEEQQG
jgi:prefoldin alpha subunit